MFEFSSMSAEVKDIVRNVVCDGKEHERKELVSIIENEVKNKGSLTPGVTAGVLKMLTANGELAVVRRGVYRLGVSSGKVNLRQQVEGIMIKFQRELDKVCTVNTLQLEDGDIDFLKKVKHISDNLEADIWSLIDDGSKEEETAEPVQEDKEEIADLAVNKTEPKEEKKEDIKTEDRAEMQAESKADAKAKAGEPKKTK